MRPSEIKTKQAQDEKILTRTAIVTGILFLFAGYILSPDLSAILRANLGLAKDNNNGKVLSLLISKGPSQYTTDNLINYELSLKPEFCKIIPKGQKITQVDQSFLAVVNKNFGYAELPEFDDVVYLRDFSIESYQFTRLRKEPAKNLSQMFAEMKVQKLRPFISSGYRTFSDQQNNVNTWTNIVGANKAKEYAAEPGFSEHHLGTTVDILTYENKLYLEPTYSKTKLSAWLKANAYRFGFVSSYPEGSELITGYTYEPWHYRYVGLEIATKIHQKNLVLQEYLYQLNNYCLVE